MDQIVSDFRLASVWESARARWEIVRALRLAGRGPLVLIGASTLAGMLFPLGFMVTTGLVVGEVPGALEAGLDSDSGRRLLSFVGLLGALFVGSELVQPLSSAARSLTIRRIDGRLREQTLAAAVRGAGVGHLAEKETQDRLSMATYRSTLTGWTPADAVGGLVALVPRYLTALASAAIVAWFFWWVALLLVAAALVIRGSYRREMVRHRRVSVAGSPDVRAYTYYLEAGLMPPAAKELRLFGLFGVVRERFGEAARGYFGHRTDRGDLVKTLLLVYPLGAIAAVVALVVFGQAAVDGRFGIATLTVLAQAAVATLSLGRFFWDADYQIAFGMAALPALRALDEQTAELERAQRGIQDAAGMPSQEIRFEDLRFTYPGQTREVLAGVELVVRAGSSVAIVGLNGAGKTTLTKLLARLYEPTAGRIVVDGVPLAELNAESWQRRIAVIFQDFARWELSAAENIGFGAPELLEDRGAIEEAAARAGAASFLAELPRGLDTVLSRTYNDGGELSGGQWQRVALARALLAVRGGAQVLVLDEPTANLDVRAEAELFDRFLELTEGLTTILISHRFSTVRRADRICVLSEGRVAEYGSHDELLALNGLYAEMFHLQASRFAEGSDEEREEIAPVA